MFWPPKDENVSSAVYRQQKAIVVWESEAREQQELANLHERRQALYDSGTWLAMHDGLVESEERMALWRQALFGRNDPRADEIIFRYSLGHLPTYISSAGKFEALSIPHWGPQNTLLTIQYRLLAQVSDKYRFQAGFPATFFLTKPLEFGNTPETLVVEGAKKAMITAMFMPEWNVIGIPSKRPPQRLLSALGAYEKVYLALDPDAHDEDGNKDSAVAYAAKNCPAQVLVVDVPAKPDDLFTLYGCTKRDMEEMIKHARRII